MQSDNFWLVKQLYIDFQDHAFNVQFWVDGLEMKFFLIYKQEKHWKGIG